MQVTCPSCCSCFEIEAPWIGELPCDIDYDCEVCCRPMRIACAELDGEVVGEAYGIGDLGPGL